MATLGNYGQAYTGKVIDPSQGGAVVDYTPNQSQPNQSITPASLAPQTPITPVTPPETPVPNVSGELQATLDSIEKQYAPLPNEGQVTDIQRKIAQLTGETAQETARRSQLENTPEVQAQRQNVIELTNRLRNIQAQGNAIPIKIQEQFAGRGATVAGIAPIQAGAQRQNAIEALTTTALLQGAQGNLTLALDNVDRAIKAEFEPKKAELVALQANLEAIKNDPASTREEKRRAAQQQAIVADRQKRIALEEENKRAISDLRIQAASLGADNLTLKAMEMAKTKEEAQNILLQTGLLAPKVSMDNQIVKLDNGETVVVDKNSGKIVNRLGGGKQITPVGSTVITTSEGKTVSISPEAQNWVSLINNGEMSLDEALTKIGSTASSMKLKNEIISGINAQGGRTESKLQQIKSNIQNIDDILGGDFEYFGASIAPREGFLGKLVGGNPYYEAFKEKVDNLVSSLTVDNLGLLKGPMSDKDIEFVKSLSSGLNIKMSEEEAKNRLEQIKTRLQEKLNLASPSSQDATQNVNLRSLRSKYNY